jgi:hypothetical protein
VRERERARESERASERETSYEGNSGLFDEALLEERGSLLLRRTANFTYATPTLLYLT